MMLPGELMRAYQKRCSLSKDLLLIPLSFYGNNAPCCQADQDFSKTPKTPKTSAALAAWLLGSKTAIQIISPQSQCLPPLLYQDRPRKLLST